MRSARLLLVAPTATALVFTGLSPAWAGDDHHHNGDDAWAELLEIADEAELEDGGDGLEVSFKYKCEDNGEELVADVRAENGSEYEKDDVDLRCDGDVHWRTVVLKKVGDKEAKEGDELDVTVTIELDGDDEELTEEVEVDDDDDDHDGDHDHDKDRHH